LLPVDGIVGFFYVEELRKQRYGEETEDNDDDDSDVEEEN
jgi:hypothetical protein